MPKVKKQLRKGTMKNEINVVLKDHPFTRSYNTLGGAIDIKSHDWIHINVKFLAKPEQYEPLLKAFSSQEPFVQLGWQGSDRCPTKTIGRWTVRCSPVAREEGDSLWLAFECLGQIPEEFFQYLASRLQIRVRISYCPPYARKWLIKLYEPALEN